jgi:hypothetical protein
LECALRFFVVGYLLLQSEQDWGALAGFPYQFVMKVYRDPF